MRAIEQISFPQRVPSSLKVQGFFSEDVLRVALGINIFCHQE